MDLNALYKSLNTAYDPQRQSIATQSAALPSFYNAQRTGLEQARTNAFKDITTQANTRGGYFSGFSPDAQAQYTGATYIPAMGNIANAQSTAKQSLLDQLNQINAQQTTQASGLFQTVQDRAQQQKQFEQTQLAQQTQWNQQQAQWQAEQAAALDGGGGGGSMPKLTAAEQSNSLKQEATNNALALMQNAWANGADPGTGYTEEKIIPILQSAYPELKPQDIFNIVYPIRKSNYGF